MTTPSVGTDVRELELSYTSGKTVKYYNDFRKLCIGFCKS